MNTPLRNSKGANKPFRSPFSNTGSSVAHAICSNLRQKRHVPQEPSVKKLRTSDKDNESCLERSDAEKVDANIAFSELTRADLESKRQKVQDMEKTANELRTKLLYHKHTKAENLEEDIKKWREVCQTALERLLRETREKSDSSCTMSQILSSLGIPETLVKYSNVTDDFFE